MTAWDFLAQAGFWEWIGLIAIAAIAGECVIKTAHAFRRKS